MPRLTKRRPRSEIRLPSCFGQGGDGGGGGGASGGGVVVGEDNGSGKQGGMASDSVVTDSAGDASFVLVGVIEVFMIVLVHEFHQSIGLHHAVVAREEHGSRQFCLTKDGRCTLLSQCP